MTRDYCKEKWILGGCSGRMITTPSGYIGDGFIADVDTKENAQRIIDCVNACASLANPQEAIADLAYLRKEVERLRPLAKLQAPIF